MRMRGSGLAAGGRKGDGGGGGSGRKGDGGGGGFDREGGGRDASGDGDASSGGRRSPLGRASGSAATSWAGYSKRSGGGAGHTASSVTPETNESSPEEVFDAEQLATYQEADWAEFVAKVQRVARALLTWLFKYKARSINLGAPLSLTIPTSFNVCSPTVSGTHFP